MPYKRKVQIPPQANLEANIISLPNGIRIIHKYVPYTRTVHCGFVINVGSRDDNQEQPGLAHFIEHMIFKGTPKRKTYHVLNYLESVGGELNAYTTKEKTCIYASLSADYVDRATELLTDITFNAIFPDREIVKEREVIAEEIDMYRNAPDEAIFEDFDQMLYPGHPLGVPILGYKESIQTIDKQALRGFVDQFYTQGNITYSIVGNVPPRMVNRLIDKYLAHLVLPTGNVNREEPGGFSPTHHQVHIPTNQAHEIIGGRAYPIRHPQYYSFSLLTNMLGGPAMNSRLNLNIREKHGLAYSINTFYGPFSDSGFWGIYYACEAGKLARVRQLVHRELKSLCQSPVGSLRLHQMKKQLIGQIILSYESLLSQMLGLAKDVLDFDEILPFSAYIAGLENVTAQDLLEVSNELLMPDSLAMISYLPEE